MIDDLSHVGMWLCVCVCVCTSFSEWLFVSLSLSLSLCFSVCLGVYLCVCVRVGRGFLPKHVRSFACILGRVHARPILQNRVVGVAARGHQPLQH